MSKPSGLRLSLAVAVAVLSSSLLAVPAASAPPDDTTAAILERLGGEPCPGGSAFTCVTLTVPLDHFDPADERTVDVAFSILPATGQRKGMFVTAVGGPGASGLLAADVYTSTLDPRIPERFDIVFFDQRGVGRSGGVSCPEAAAAWDQVDARARTPEQEATVKEGARTFAADCRRQLSREATPLLPFLGTDQAVEDLEAFRRVLGDDRFWLYGESYGTQYAQTYAAVHGEHLAGLLLDGTVDLTTGGTDYFADQARGFGETLLGSLQACNADPACAPEVGGDAVAAYDELVGRLDGGDLEFRFPRPGGGFADRRLTLANLESTALSQTYTEADRMLFTRALAAWASRQDPVPLARLAYAALGLDPDNLDVVPSPEFSDAMYYAVDCRDYSYPGADPEDKAENFVRAGDRVDAGAPRLASAFSYELPCAYWPAAVAHLERPGPLQAEGIPTIVLNGTADPATPYHQAVDVYRRLDDGYLITKTGGSHVLFGWGDPCVEGPVTDFLVEGKVPPERETTCEGVVAADYVPLAPERASGFEDQWEAFVSLETELNHFPEYLYWDGSEPAQVGCPYGGTVSFAPEGDHQTFSFSRCTFTRDFTVTGAGTYHVDDDTFAMDVSTRGRWDCQLHYRRTMDTGSVSGPCRGEQAA
jgi:pimeloyl-ACP methyl ester carboxylesterase